MLRGDRQVFSLGDGKHSDGNGLYLYVNKDSRHWYARITKDGKRKDYPLGSALEVTPSEAREELVAKKIKIRKGINPATTIPTNSPTFEDMVRRFYTSRWLPPDAKARRGNVGKYQTQWIEDFERHVFPQIGNLIFDEIKAPVILVALEPI